jgi:hypothetical protein
MLMRFKVNDRVKWESQSGGYQTTKEGVVTAVVPAGITPHDMVANAKAQGWNVGPLVGAGMMRNHESYLVSVERDGKAKPVLYWPRVHWLRKV